MAAPETGARSDRGGHSHRRTRHGGIGYRHIRTTDQGVRVEIVLGGEPEAIEAERLLIATGQRPNAQGLGLEEAGVERIYVQWLDLDDLDPMKETVDIVRGG